MNAELIEFAVRYCDDTVEHAGTLMRALRLAQMARHAGDFFVEVICRPAARGGEWAAYGVAS